MVYIGIVGSRRRDSDIDFLKVEDTLKELLALHSSVTLVSGGCPKGADRFADVLAVQYMLPTIIYKPDTTKLKARTNWAWAEIFYARNTQIAEKSDILIACVAADRKGGTEDTIKKYLKLGKTKLILV